jgi:hypothetical protein
MTDSLERAYLGALALMEQTGPRDLHTAANFVDESGEFRASDESLRAYLSSAGKDDGLRTRLHLALATWDHAADPPWADSTEPNTDGRRSVIVRRLMVDDDTARVFLHHFPVARPDGDTIIADTWEEWYTEEIRQNRDFYWKHYRELLVRKGFSPDAITAMDDATTEVVRRLSNPARDEAYQSKGLVVGYVQSGKTANFTGVIAKAIDAGFRLVIVLTGTTDLLRAQTQRRLDMELVGTENILGGVSSDDLELMSTVDYQDDTDWLEGRFLRHGVEPATVGKPAIDRLTTYAFDYKSLKQGISALDFPKRERTLPFFRPENLFSSDARLAVVKKNATVLKKLVTDLRKIKARLEEIPTLIIDDESDQASVNTSNPRKWAEDQRSRTRINALISEFLRNLPRAQYVGYTATPFANVFIDPSDAEDIFPKDFLISLRRPPGYMGASDFHDLEVDWEDDQRTVARSAELAHVRFLTDEPADDDQSLLRALDTFVLTGAIKLYRAAKGVKPFRHHTMLVHEAMHRVVHRQQADNIQGLWRSAGYFSASAGDRLRLLFDDDLVSVSRAVGGALPMPVSYDELRPYISEAVMRIGHNGNPVLVVNSDKDIEQEELDFDRRPVWRVLVGGNKLARGFTVEGLTVSYYRRATKQQDTMMQMGRWCGFRQNYRDLVRLYITHELYDGFEATVRGEEFFREELRRYAAPANGERQLTPKEIPPLVAQHVPWLKPTARSKMYNARLVERRSPGFPLEPRAHPSDPNLIEANTRAFLPLLSCAKTLEAFGSASLSYDAHFGLAPHDTLINVLRNLAWPDETAFLPDLTWLTRLTPEQITDWAVLMPQHVRATFPRRVILGIGPLSLFRRTRLRPNYFGPISELRHRPAAERIAGILPTGADSDAAERLVSPRRGALIVYPVIEKNLVLDENEEISSRQVVVAFHLVAPLTTRSADDRLVTFAAVDSARRDAPIIDAV